MKKGQLDQTTPWNGKKGEGQKCSHLQNLEEELKMGAKIVFDLYDIYLDNILKVFSVYRLSQMFNISCSYNNNNRKLKIDTEKLFVITD